VAKRQFTTEDGVVWVVWDVHPDDLGRTAYDRRASTPPGAGSLTAERMSRRNERSVHPELQQGWLCFQSATEKRRFTPIPANWYELLDDELRTMLHVAIPAPRADGRLSRPSATD
jgi:hypothetical protein